MFDDKTMTFSLGQNREDDIKQILTIVYDALKEKGYNPISQLVGYIIGGSHVYYNPQQRTQLDPPDRPRRIASGIAEILFGRINHRTNDINTNRRGWLQL